VRRGGPWAKHMGLKRAAIGNTLGEHIGNMLGTKGKRKNPPAPPPGPTTENLKGKKSMYFECMLGLPIGCMKFLFPKLLVIIFGLG